jgi:hypothetical protein
MNVIRWPIVVVGYRFRPLRNSSMSGRSSILESPRRAFRKLSASSRWRVPWAKLASALSFAACTAARKLRSVSGETRFQLEASCLPFATIARIA